jgi:DNA-binding LytR/AlgR family response regulator
MRILLVDDEPLALRRMEVLISRRPRFEVIGSCRDGKRAIEAIQELKPDVVLLDVRMPGMDGLEVARLVKGPDMPIIIFVTAYDAFAIEAFEAAAIDYLLKPVEAERLDLALARARQLFSLRDAESRAGELQSVVDALRHAESPQDDDIWIKDRDGSVRVSKGRIDWVEAEGDYVRIHCGDRSWLLRETMNAMESQLDSRLFLRVHRSAIVNRRRISRAGQTPSGGRVLHLDDATTVRVGRSYERALREALGRVTG